jgi:hypothetical protein
MVEDIVRQRIKFLIEHGELYPTERPAERSLVVRAVILILILQVVDIVLSLVTMHGHS